MKKSILNLGKALDKAEQKEINGGELNCFCYINGTIRRNDCYACPDGTLPMI